MPEKNLQRNLAFKMYAESGGTLTAKAIATKLEVPTSRIYTWKYRDNWDLKLGLEKSKAGAPKGNTNSSGNRSNPENTFAEITGTYSSPRMEHLTEEQRRQVELAGTSLDAVLAGRLQRELAKEFDLENRINKLRPYMDDDDKMYTDRDTLMETEAGTTTVCTTRSSAHTRIMQLETELGRTSSRINRLLSTAKTSAAEAARIDLERQRLELARQKAVGIFELDDGEDREI